MKYIIPGVLLFFNNEIVSLAVLCIMSVMVLCDLAAAASNQRG